ncbi:hypothetical protein LTR64_004764 [Lithohypha guttulata]|uniref:uncharacterized protein n=1 Tax=Lithohypha guttulata TaxID=1690604 RepID=UPI00315D2E54
MVDATFYVAPTTPLKRSYDDDTIVVNQDSAVLTNTAINEQDIAIRHASPAPSTSSSLTDLTASVDAPGSAIKSSQTPVTKRPKLSFAEKQAEKAAKQREKDEKARLKAEETARKEEEKRRLAEEKEISRRAKDLEKAEKQKVKDAGKALKDAQKAQKAAEKKQKDAEKEAERLRKERSQMRLGNFFSKPKTEATPPSTPEDVSDGASSRRSSVVSIDAERPTFEPKKLNQPSNPDYEKFILPFFIADNTEIAPANRFKLDREVVFQVTTDSEATQLDLREQFGRPVKRLRKTIPVRDIIQNIQATGLDIIELDSPALEALSRASYKCLQFKEDVRPPYQGTYTRAVSPRTTKKLKRNPFTRALPETNYDYDSEAEWEPPGEDDEDLDEEDEMSDGEDGLDDMADFLDDADDLARKKGPSSDMEPVSSGLCWVGETFDDNGTDLQRYRMDFLHDSTTFPIDPFSTKHWSDESGQKFSIKSETSSSMQPPRQPLLSISPNTLPTIKVEADNSSKPTLAAKQKRINSDKQLKLIQPDLMADFRRAVDGSDLTKLGLIEILKKQFPQCSKEAIKDTLTAVAVRVGKKETEKKWQLVDDS